MAAQNKKWEFVLKNKHIDVTCQAPLKKKKN